MILYLSWMKFKRGGIMARSKKTITGKDGFAAGKSTSQEESILMHLKNMVKTDTKVYYILWKYAPELITE